MCDAELSQNIKKLLCEADGRANVIAATKTVDVGTINKIYDMGIRSIGENRVQELLEKYEHYDKRFDVHFIGRLQRNKVKYLIGKVSLIHSLDSVELAEEIDRRSRLAGECTRCLVELNGGEEAKGGIPILELDGFLDRMSRFDNIRVCGLMTVSPKFEEKQKKLDFFAKISKIFIDNKAKKVDNNITMDVLSMGMTGDYREALRCGSNCIRIGEGIFGKRNYNTK